MLLTCAQKPPHTAATLFYVLRIPLALPRRETTHLSRPTEGFPVESKKLARQKLFRQSKKKTKHENHAKLEPRVETFRCNSGKKFLHIQNRRNYFIFFLSSSCVKNSRRDEKSLNDDWRKLHRKQKEKKREKIVFVLRGSCEYEKGVKIATCSHTHTSGEPGELLINEISHARVIINFCTKLLFLPSGLSSVCLMSFSSPPICVAGENRENEQIFIKR